MEQEDEAEEEVKDDWDPYHPEHRTKPGQGIKSSKFQITLDTTVDLWFVLTPSLLLELGSLPKNHILHP